VGDDALVDYPHPRHACAVFKFETTNHRTHCPNCWYAKRTRETPYASFSVEPARTRLRDAEKRAPARNRRPREPRRAFRSPPRS